VVRLPARPWSVIVLETIRSNRFDPPPAAAGTMSIAPTRPAYAAAWRNAIFVVFLLNGL
jgi:hypothetical protein